LVHLIEMIPRDPAEHRRANRGCMSTRDVQKLHHVVVRRAVVGRKPFIWEIKHKLSDRIVARSAQSFTSLDEAHSSGMTAILNRRWADAREQCVQ
jgi:hypothetical protein